MEKRTPHYPLSRVKALIEADEVRSTLTALAGAAALGLDFDGMLDVIRELRPADFYKSMTTPLTIESGRMSTDRRRA